MVPDMTAVGVYAAIAMISLIAGPFFLPPTSWAQTTGERLMLVGFLAFGWPVVLPVLFFGAVRKRPQKAVAPESQASASRERGRLPVLAGE